MVSIIMILPGVLLALIWTGIFLADAGVLWANVTPGVKYMAAVATILIAVALAYVWIRGRRG